MPGKECAVSGEKILGCTASDQARSLLEGTEDLSDKAAAKATGRSRERSLLSVRKSSSTAATVPAHVH